MCLRGIQLTEELSSRGANRIGTIVLNRLGAAHVSLSDDEVHWETLPPVDLKHWWTFLRERELMVTPSSDPKAGVTTSANLSFMLTCIVCPMVHFVDGAMLSILILMVFSSSSKATRSNLICDACISAATSLLREFLRVFIFIDDFFLCLVVHASTIHLYVSRQPILLCILKASMKKKHSIQTPA
jgi:hypothetical protein